MSNKSFNLYCELTENSVIREDDQGLGDLPTHTKISVTYSKGRGYYARIQNVTRIHQLLALCLKSAWLI